MNRGIRFRGKRKSSRKKYQTWVYGGFFPDVDGTNYILFNAKNGDISWEEVIPETVGQYTGLQDADGIEEIYEGDILESQASENKEDWKRWVCLYEDGSFCFETDIGKRKRKIEQNLLCEDEIELYGLVVIGNIHDNPELLEVEK